MATVYATCNSTVMSLPGVNRAIKREADACGYRADTNLRQARAASTHERIEKPDHTTFISVDKAPEVANWFVCLHGYNPFAIEFGHYPSGYFSPAKYGKITKAPAGLYILTRAAGVASGNLNLTVAPFPRPEFD